MTNYETMKDFVSGAAPGGHDEDSTIFFRLLAAHFISANFSWKLLTSNCKRLQTES